MHSVWLKVVLQSLVASVTGREAVLSWGEGAFPQVPRWSHAKATDHWSREVGATILPQGCWRVSAGLKPFIWGKSQNLPPPLPAPKALTKSRVTFWDLGPAAHPPTRAAWQMHVKSTWHVGNKVDLLAVRIPYAISSKESTSKTQHLFSKNKRAKWVKCAFKMCPEMCWKLALDGKVKNHRFRYWRAPGRSAALGWNRRRVSSFTYHQRSLLSGADSIRLNMNKSRCVIKGFCWIKP